MTNPFNSGPIAPERNPPINPQYFKPSQFFISAITYGISTTVTTTVDHNYVIGQNTRLLIPFASGASQLNEQEGLVIAIPAADQVTLNITSLNTDPFVYPPAFGNSLPQIVAVGDQNSGQINASGRVQNITYVPGSFLNISPV